jgi:hypothetical protein
VSPAPFYLLQGLEEILEKKHVVAGEVFVNCYSFNPITQVKKRIFKVSYKTTVLEARAGAGTGARAERDIFGSTTQVIS